MTEGLAQPTLHPSAKEMISSYRHSRAEADKSFESQTPGMCLSGSKTTTAAANGPARHPRPTSSTPATLANPKRLIAFSIVRRAVGLDIPAILGFGRLSAKRGKKFRPWVSASARASWRPSLEVLANNTTSSGVLAPILRLQCDRQWANVEERSVQLLVQTILCGQ